MTPERIAEIRQMVAPPYQIGAELPQRVAKELLDALEAAQQEIADLKRGVVVVPEIPTWEDGENKLRRGETLTALEKFVMDHDWNKMDVSFRDGLEAVFDELRTSLRAQPTQEPTA